MGGQFVTYGPFAIGHKLGDLDEQQIAQWFDKEIDAKHPNLSEAVGVYIICAASGTSDLIPWYVGKTVKGFLKRFRQHAGRKKGFGGSRKEWANNGSTVFFIALSSGKREFRKPVTGRNKVLAINAIEEMLIQDCLKLNSDLLNVSQKTLYRDLTVPGYIGSKKDDISLSAKALAKMLAN